MGTRLEVTLHHGDMYFMSHKAVGNHWLKKSIFTLRHAAGEETIRLRQVAERRRAAKKKGEDEAETSSDESDDE